MIVNSVEFFKNKTQDDFPKGTEIILAAWKIMNPENIGQVIRLAHNVGAKKVLFISAKNDYRESKIKKTAGFSYDQMDWDFISENDFFKEIDAAFEVVALETCEGSKNIFKTILPQKIVLLAGNESHGLPVEMISKCKERIYIPMSGGCKSMNISHALSVAAFEWYRQVVKY